MPIWLLNVVPALLKNWIWFAIPVGLIALWGYGKYQHHEGVVSERVKTEAVQSAWDADKARRIEQLSRINVERVEAVARADDNSRQAEKNRRDAMVPITARVTRGPMSGRVAVGLLTDAIRASNGQVARSTEEIASDTTASPIVPNAGCAVADYSAYQQWGFQLLEQYSACRQQVIDWNAYYNNLRTIQ